jgi:lysophospholipase L1-like esterase
VITATYPDLSRFIDLRQRSRRRVRRGLSRFNAACREAAAHHGVLCLEGSGHPAADEPASFAGDGFHPSSEGHRRAAADVLRALEGWLEVETRPKETA